MVRKVSICTLCADKAQGSAEYLKQKLSAYTEISEIKDFGDPVSFAEGVNSCTAMGGAVVAAAPVSMFLKAKFRLMKSLSAKIVRSGAIVSAMGANAPADPKEKDLQAAIPEKASVIASPNGLYCGFAKKSSENILIFLPLEENILDHMFTAGLDAVFAKAFPKTQAEKPQKTQKSGVVRLKSHIEGVISSGKTVAISPVGCAKPLISAISTVPGCEEAFVVDSALRDRLQGESTEDYVAQCAKISKENSGADLGIGISNIYNERNGGEDFVIVCVADSQRAKAAKVYAKPGEDKKHLIVAAVIKLCEMLDELSVSGLVNPNPPVKQTKKWAKNSKTPIIIAIIALAVAIVVCVILAFVMGGKESDSTLTYAGQSEYAMNESNTIGGEDYEFDYQGGSSLDPFGDLNSAVMVSELETDAFGGYTSTSGVYTALAMTTQKITATTAKVLTTLSTTAAKITTTIKTTAASTTAKLTTTTKKPTTTSTTAKATTTKKAADVSQGVTASAASGDATFTNGSKGTFVFRVYGYGHGVGMSQDGAIRMAKDGSTYDEILMNYFTGTSVKTDSSTPATVKYGGKDIPLVEYLCRTAKPEIGAGAPTEALKAQMVCAYTYAKWYNFDVAKSRHAYDSDYEYEGTNLHKACLELLGMSSDTDTPSAPYVDYNGKAAFTCYFANAAGKTASADSVWGGGDSQYPYLAGGAKSPETVDTSTVEISAEDMKKLIEEYAKDNNIEIVLDSDPAKWLEIIEHDSSYSKNIGYVTTMRVGNYEMKGNAFRSYVVDFKLRSHCYTFEYVPAPEETTTKAHETTETTKTETTASTEKAE